MEGGELVGGGKTSFHENWEGKTRVSTKIGGGNEFPRELLPQIGGGSLGGYHGVTNFYCDYNNQPANNSPPFTPRYRGLGR